MILPLKLVSSYSLKRPTVAADSAQSMKETTNRTSPIVKHEWNVATHMLHKLTALADKSVHLFLLKELHAQRDPSVPIIQQPWVRIPSTTPMLFLLLSLY